MALTPISREELERQLDGAIGKTLGEIDSEHKKLFEAEKASTNKGIAGDIIEISLLGFGKNSDQEPDMILDKVPTELKTTGIEIKKGRKKSDPLRVVPKEPISVTSSGVTKEKPFQLLEIQDFDKSHLWAKSEHIVFAYYHYDRSKKIGKKLDMRQYANFVFQGYQYYDMNEEEKSMLKKDWQVVYDFVKDVKDKKLDYMTEFEKITKLRSKMICMDLAPGWKKGTPRFRFNKGFSTTIIQQKFPTAEKVVKAGKRFDSIESLNAILREFTNKYEGKSVQYILEDLGIIRKKIDKKIVERVLAKAFGAESSKLRSLDIFQKTNIIPKTVILKEDGKPTEDMKLDSISFDTEFVDKKYIYDDSELYSYINDYRFLIPVFQEPRKPEKNEKIPLSEDVLVGFKLIYLDSKDSNNSAKNVWKEIQDLVVNKKLKIEKIYNKDGSPKVNKNGIQSEAPNFPKSKDYDIFVRGTGKDSSAKTLELNGLKMYQQNYWLKRTKVIDLLNKTEYIK
ncbi:MutH/Sau3AI family endonuclease [Holdemanella porci]|uniref:MutH/Sau3AI family endonuclease n=1 Tax=Holdemanella porci TaxID=2652276 RepID=UPI003AB6666B